TAAVPRSSQAAPNASTSGWVMYAYTVTPGTSPPRNPYARATASSWILFSELVEVFRALTRYSGRRSVVTARSVARTPSSRKRRDQLPVLRLRERPRRRRPRRRRHPRLGGLRQQPARRGGAERQREVGAGAERLPAPRRPRPEPRRDREGLRGAGADGPGGGHEGARECQLHPAHPSSAE